MVQIQIIGAFDGVFIFPLFRGAVAARREKAVQHGEEDSPLDGKLKAPAFKQARQNFVDTAGLPHSLEDQGRANLGTASGDALASGVGTEHRELFREAPQRLKEGVELPTGEQLIETTETVQDALLYLAVYPLVIDDEQISAGTVGLGANEQLGAPMSPSYPHLKAVYKRYRLDRCSILCH